MRILVTGSTGFVGKALQPRFEEAGHLVIPLQGRASREVRVRWATAIGFHRPDMIVHLAGRVGGIQDNIDHPVEMLRDNLGVGMDLLTGAYRAGVMRILNMGSSCMYPVGAPQPFREESLLTGPVEPTNEAYALAKLTVLRLCQYYNAQRGTQFKTLIPPGLYGPHAHFDGDKAHLVGAVMARLHAAKEAGDGSVTTWGDGTARREFLYVGDLVDCIVRAIAQFDSLPEIMNVGPGEDLSVDEWTREIAGVVGYRGEFAHDASRPSGQARKVMSVDRARAWGWRARTPVAHGLRQTYDWLVGQVAVPS